MDDPKRLSRGLRTAFGLMFMAAGVAPMLAAFDIGPLHSTDINGPPWLGLVAGAVFALAGFAVLAGGMPPLAGSIIALILVIGLAAIGNWVAFGAGERLCAGSISLPFAGAAGDYSGLACRIPFGIGALVIDGIVLLFAARALQQALGGPPRLARLVQAGEWAVLLGLAPILLPMLLFLVLRSAGEVLVARLKTGKWPRNEAFIARRKVRKQDRPKV